MVTIVDHEMVSGDTATPFEFTVVDEDGAPRDITGCHLSYQARYSESPDSAIAISKDTVGGGVEIVDGPAGQARVVFDAVDTEDIDSRALPYEVQLESIDGQIETVFMGALRVSRDRVT